MKRLPEFHSVRTIKFTPRSYAMVYEQPRYWHCAKIKTGNKLETFIFSDNDSEVNPRAVINKWKLQHMKLFEPVSETSFDKAA